MKKGKSLLNKMTVIYMSTGLILCSATGALAQNGNGNSGSQGASNGQPFQQLQQAIDAASDAAQSAIDANSSAIDANASAIDSNAASIAAEEAAREAGDAAVEAAAQAALAAEAAARISADDILTASSQANASAISANTSSIEAEESARIAADAAAAASFAADLAAEAAARISGDLELQEAVAAEEAARNAELDLIGERITTLEGFHAVTNELQFVETSGYDTQGVRDQFSALDFQPGDWFYWSAYDNRRNRTSAICTNTANAYNAVVNFVNRTTRTLVYGGASSWTLRSGSTNWIQGLTNRFVTTSTYLRVYGSGVNSVLLDRNGPSAFEVYVFGYGVGNAMDFKVGNTRMEACGF